MSYRTASAATLCVCSLWVTGCGVDDERASLPQVTPITSSAESAPENRVDPETFRGPGDGHVFKYPSANGRARECFFDAEGATCLGVAGPDVPDISVPPFADQAPSAVSVSDTGVRYTLFEGVPPAQVTLERGQWFELGSVRCEVDEALDLTCSVGENSFRIDGDSGLISTEGVVVEH
ncbi:hypothetical protein [Corynebacterium doosanense]|uniref:Lipoprotein n=1 Tax=Corynebacterium doosanense CAU 212 = DSM 45436 TaxID=558173 RepID=A0A097IJN1_9CORY|nr:hypothetical protein [Corynebacterium doosanense]AIT62320.1 hypothetical protein CDOO_11090 [Corynebacterium doosanense CAU 212 = DSM 45436]